MTTPAVVALAAAVFAVTCGTALAQGTYDPGATDTEIKIGNIMAYSGPASAYGVIGKTEAAYFNKINVEGGINGRKIKFISYDDGYSPPRAVEQVHKLVDNDHVLLVFNPLGTPSNSAIRKYLNTKQIPQLFVASGASKWDDPRHFPWTMGWEPSYQADAHRYAKYILNLEPNGRIGVLYQNDGFGRDYLKGLKDGLGASASMIVDAESYETTEPTIDAHIDKLKAAGADIFLSITTPKFAAQGIKRLGEIAWHPMQILVNVSASVGGVIEPAGYENSQGILSTAYAKDASDPQWDDDPGMEKFYAFLKKYYPAGDKRDAATVYGYGVAQTLVQVLKQCGDDLTRANVMKQAASLKDFQPDTLLPGIRINTSPTDFAPIKQLQMMRFKGRKWQLFGPIQDGALTN
jgi:branched-chain amino acid transport system substrate-binding protein